MPEQTVITCPHCTFRRSVPQELMSNGAKRATCPHCKEPFTLSAETIAREAAQGNK